MSGSEPDTPVRAEDITAIVLCGGSGARLGGIDKPLLRVGDHRLIDHVVGALRRQVGGLVISCGPDVAPYRALGYPTVVDEVAGDGPLGGIVSSLPLVLSDWILTYPGDSPFADPGLVARLAPAAEASGIAVPQAEGHRQNLTLLLSRPRALALAGFHAAGGRAVRTWLDREQTTSVDMSDVADSFFNVNTPADVEACERRLREAAEPGARSAAD